MSYLAGEVIEGMNIIVAQPERSRLVVTACGLTRKIGSSKGSGRRDPRDERAGLTM
jgi:hypothetical protein